ncbi:sphingomyelinase family [Ophiocordyceps camponoti-floridani]|uniref:Sphingomyelinase family n=1 Tax=Ophiocordyceps camponoti-floridani TaxID=2030778 RepID=A0A8H4Q117_9HYPO|nr:sphingomyelinase family [Ophiocordyceps camponoti-floridani]
MSLFAWCSRRAGGLSMLALLALCYWVITDEATRARQPAAAATASRLDRFRPSYSSAKSSSLSSSPSPGTLTSLFAYYCLLIHILVFIFPLRACWSVWDITRSLRKLSRTHGRSYETLRLGLRRRGSSTSISSSETLTSDSLTSDSNGFSSTNSEASDEPDMYTDATDVSDDSVIHAIVIPNYKEELDTLKETLDVLASHPRAQFSYDIYLGMEQREVDGESKALSLIQEFVKKFRSIDYTIHPAGIPGESAGKGSNLGWAAKKLSAKYSMGIRKNVVVTGIDADSHLSPSYFTNVTFMHQSYPDTAATTLYAAPIVFDRNAHKVPAIVRVADILWCAAGMSGLYRTSTIAPPTSVYSLPLLLVDRVGGWDCDAEAIGEDLHMYLKCFFALNGNLTCRTVLSPVSQSNVTGGGKGGVRGTVIDMHARYKQALRHMWGALDTGFALREAVVMWQERKRTSRAFRPLHRSHGDSSDCYFPENNVSDDSLGSVPETGVFSDVTQNTLKEPQWLRVLFLFHRLFEAHFLPVHMTILILASTLYMWAVDGEDHVDGLRWIFSVCNVLRTLGFVEVALYLFLYESFHRICVKTRRREMNKANLADGMCFSERTFRANLIDYVLVPLVAPIYGAIPCAQAEISHFWTVDLIYTVSLKATRQRARSFVAADLA